MSSHTLGHYSVPPAEAYSCLLPNSWNTGTVRCLTWQHCQPVIHEQCDEVTASIRHN